MFVIVRERPAIICDVCGFGVQLHKGEIIASVAQLKGHLPQALITCGEACRIMAEHRLEVKPLYRLPLRDALESLLRE